MFQQARIPKGAFSFAFLYFSISLPISEYEVITKSQSFIRSKSSSLAEEPENKEVILEMQAMIVLISKSFLLEANVAKNIEYDLAMKHHIPLIPVLVGNVDESLFVEAMNSICKGYGDIQYLNYNDHDKSHDSFWTKLNRRLDSTIFPDDVSDKIRAAFDAYIFLSYRKKDRQYAKKLMQVIHDIPYCRDIAIWYDEYLVPGEAWNAAIAEAMLKSKLVALAVTPNVTETGNYIISTEYPDAVRLGKKVIPAQLADITKEELSKLNNLANKELGFDLR